MENEKRALFYKKLDNSEVECLLCPHGCIIQDGNLGICNTRRNIEGELYSINYGRLTSLALDPIEKKPLNLFHPGSVILSAGSFGCNLHCTYCQNWVIAHDIPMTMELSPKDLVEKAYAMREGGNIGIAYTYNEPSVWFEYLEECLKLAKEKGLYNVVITNGYINQEPMEMLLPYIDAMNIDIKAFTDSFYKDICSGGLEAVKRTISQCVGRCHVELTCLIVPGLNDKKEEMDQMCQWIASISREIPLHISRYFPNYKLTHIPPTPNETLEELKKIADTYLDNVYLGNVW